MENQDNNQDGKDSQVSFSKFAAEQNRSSSPEGDDTQMNFSRLNGDQVSEELTSENPDASPDARKDSVAPDQGKRIYDQTIEYLSQVYHDAKSGGRIILTDCTELIEKIIKNISTQNYLMGTALHFDADSDYIISHSVNVAILSIKLGSFSGYNHDQLVEIGMAALLHDIGSVKIPDDVLNKKSSLSAKEMDQVKQRPKYSYEILKTYQDQHPYLAEIALQVYERIDGSGYPAGLQKDEIHEYAQIIGLVDVYEALSHTRPYRQQFLHFAAGKEIIGKYKTAFQRELLKIFFNNFSIFPIYSYVRLNTGAIGRVVETYPDQPLRPMVQVLYDSQERKVLTDRRLNLPENPLLHIVDSVGENYFT